MFVKQISVFLENKTGRLAEVARILGENNIDISALSIADTTDFGILRLIVNQPEKAGQVLRDNGLTVSVTNVIAVAIANKPGGLSAALNVLDRESIGIEYLYAFVGNTTTDAMVIFRVEDLNKAVDVLAKNDIRVLPAKTVYDL